jgi:hypothetical protein
MVVSGVFTQDGKHIEGMDRSIWDDFDVRRMSVKRDTKVDVLKQIESVSDSTYVKRIVIRDSTGMPRVIIGKINNE